MTATAGLLACGSKPRVLPSRFSQWLEWTRTHRSQLRGQPRYWQSLTVFPFHPLRGTVAVIVTRRGWSESSRTQKQSEHTVFRRGLLPRRRGEPPFFFELVPKLLVDDGPTLEDLVLICNGQIAVENKEVTVDRHVPNDRPVGIEEVV